MFTFLDFLDKYCTPVYGYSSIIFWFTDSLKHNSGFPDLKKKTFRFPDINNGEMFQ
jgi:hypothetical protein